MINKKAMFSLLCAVMTVSLCSCNIQNSYSDERKSEIDLFAMDTYMSLKAYGENGDKALKKASDKIRELEKTLSVTDEQSEIFLLNNANGKRTAVSADTAFLIGRSLEISDDTNGAFDITVYPLSKEWGFTTDRYNVPSQERLNDLLNSVGSENVILDNNDNSVSLRNGANIDLGGIAKGYAGKCAAQIIRSEGVVSAVLNLGGNVQTIGAKPNGSGWIIAIKDPEDDNSSVGTVEVFDKAVVTSGGYERYFEDENGSRYCHILDPQTGRPARTDILSATVIGNDGTTCDALSTALYVMGIEGACDYLGSDREYEAILVSNDNKLYITGGLTEEFTVSEKYSKYTIVTV